MHHKKHQKKISIRKMVFDRNLDLGQGMKTTRNGKYVGRYRRNFFLIFKCL